jgi:hypothetical protein
MKKKGITEIWTEKLTKDAIDFTQAFMMVKLISTIDDRGWPHITFIASNKAKSDSQIVWGQFFEGKSKKFIQDNPKHGYLYMSIEKPMQILQIKADFSKIKTKGEDLNYFNETKEMRYNTTSNVWRVFYNEILSASPLQKLSILKLLKGILFCKIGKGGAKENLQEERLDQFGKQIFTGAMNPKFLAFLDPSDGYPIIIPCFQVLAADYTKLVFPPSLFETQLGEIPINSKVAVFGMTQEFVAQTIKGDFLGFNKYRGITLGEINIEEVYNSTPPLPGYIYPEKEVLPEVTDFSMPT